VIHDFTVRLEIYQEAAGRERETSHTGDATLCSSCLVLPFLVMANASNNLVLLIYPCIVRRRRGIFGGKNFEPPVLSHL